MPPLQTLLPRLPVDPKTPRTKRSYVRLALVMAAVLAASTLFFVVVFYQLV
jgi:hypothetical protein